MKLTKVFIVTLVLCLCIGSAVALAHTDVEWRKQQTAAQGYFYGGLTDEEIAALDKTTIYQSAESPTGFYVTFRYKDPNAKRVRIGGEFTFTTRFDASATEVKLSKAEEWTPDMFVMIPGILGSWLLEDMTFNEETGVWSYTVPLPSGTFFYSLYIDGEVGADVNDLSGAVQMSDPTNRPFEDAVGEQLRSVVRVPFDPSKQVVDYSIELPRKDGRVGLSETVYYYAKGVENEGEYQLLVYLPYGYDPERPEPYKVLYLSHGGGVESATSWYNKGSMANIMDNLIAAGLVEPFVVVCMDNYRVGFNEDNLINNIIPFVEANYNVATEDSGRAVAGLSAGGAYTYRILTKYPEYFNYYGFFSAGADRPDFELNMEELDDARMYYSVGMQEFMSSRFNLRLLNLLHGLLTHGCTVDVHIPEGGHQWSVWREQLIDFVRITLWK